MSATMSFFRAWLYGFAIFIAATASLTVALTIAITGPPTASEVEDIGAFLSNAGRELALGAEDLGAEACVQFPEAALCPQTTVASAPTPPTAESEQAIIIEAPRRVAPSEVVEEVADVRGDANEVALLGSAAGDAPVIRDRVRAEPARRERVRPAQRERRQVARAPVERRATPPRQRARADARRPAPPLAVARVEAVAPLADASTSALEALLNSSVPEIVAEEVADEGSWPTQEQAAPMRGEEEAWEAEPAYEDEPVYKEPVYEEPVYEEEPAYQSDAYYERLYAEREARRREREERRRAYLEWRRRYEGW